MLSKSRNVLRMMANNSESCAAGSKERLVRFAPCLSTSVVFYFLFQSRSGTGDEGAHQVRRERAIDLSCETCGLLQQLLMRPSI